MERCNTLKKIVESFTSDYIFLVITDSDHHLTMKQLSPSLSNYFHLLQRERIKITYKMKIHTGSMLFKTYY